MADVNVTYTIKVPDEQYIDSFSDNATKSFTYTGPEVITITVAEDGSAYSQKLDGPVYPEESVVTINVTTHPALLPVADLLWGRPYDHVLTFDEEDLGGGVIYQVPNNTTIHDWFWVPKYDLDNQAWYLDADGAPIIDHFIRDPLTPKMRTYIAKAEAFIAILDQFALSTADTTKLTNFKTALASYEDSAAKPWKYMGQNPLDLQAPKMPIELISTLNAVKAAGAGNLQILADDEIPGPQ
jgi:hypothetical protein